MSLSPHKVRGRVAVAATVASGLTLITIYAMMLSISSPAPGISTLSRFGPASLLVLATCISYGGLASAILYHRECLNAELLTAIRSADSHEEEID